MLKPSRKKYHQEKNTFENQSDDKIKLNIKYKLNGQENFNKKTYQMVKLK